MKKTIQTLVFLCISISLFSQQSFLEGVVYVKVKPSQQSYFGGQGAKPGESITSFLGVNSIKPFIRHDRLARSSEPMSSDEEVVRRIYKLEFSSTISVEQKIVELKKTGMFEVIEPAYIFEVQSATGYQPNDPDADSTLPYNAGANQLKLHDFYAAFEIEKGDTNVVIGVVDTGVNFDQEDSKTNLKFNWNDTIDGVNNDSDVYFGEELIDNFRGWDVADWDNNPTLGPGSSHGAAMISVTSATVDNNLTLAGTGFNCKYIPYKTAPDAASNSITAGYDGMYLAALQGCQVILCSWGTTQTLPQIFEDITNFCTLSLDAVIVSASGNSGNSGVYYPASFPYVLSVCGLRMDSSFQTSASNYNYFVDLSAAGENIKVSNGSNNGYKYDNGTSFSAAVTAGLAGLVRSHFPEMNALQVMRQIKVTGSYIDSMPKNKPFAGQMGKMINPYKSLVDTLSPGLMVIGQGVNNGNQQFDKDGQLVGFDLALLNTLRPSENISYSLTAITDNFEFVNSTGSLPNLNTMDTLFGLGQNITLDLFPSTDTIEQYIARIDYIDGSSIIDHDYVFFTMFPTEITSINEERNLGWNVFPTVFSSFATVEGEFVGDINLELLSIDGASVWSSNYENQMSINIEIPQSIVSGTYYLLIKDQNNSVAQKLIKIK